MSLTIPLRPDLTDYELTTALDGATYTLRLRWSEREGSWYLDVSSETGDAIALGIKVTLYQELGRRRTASAMPPGALIAVDTSRQDVEPGVSDLGDRVQLIYVPESEWVT